MKASVSTQQIIDLEHFLPTHIPVLAIYSRSFTLAAHLLEYLSLDLGRILAEESGSTPVEVLSDESTTLTSSVDPIADSRAYGISSVLDIGQKITRPVPSVPVLDLTVRTSTPTTVPTPAKHTPTPSPSRSQSLSPGLEDVVKQDSPDPDYPLNPDPAVSTVSHQPRTEIKKKKPKSIGVDPFSELSKQKTTRTAGKLDIKMIKKKQKRNDIDDIFGF